MLTDAILPILAAALFLAGICVLFLLLINILRDIRGEGRGRRLDQLPAWRIDLRRTIWILASLACIASANVTFWVNRELRLYSPIVPGVPLGTISIMHDQGTLPRLIYASTDREGRQALEVFPVRDAVFRLQGETISWSPHLGFLGLGEHFKLSRIEFFPGHTVEPGRSTYSVEVRQGTSKLFRRIESLQRWLPFVRVDTLQTDIWDAAREYSIPLYLHANRIVGYSVD